MTEASGTHCPLPRPGELGRPPLRNAPPAPDRRAPGRRPASRRRRGGAPARRRRGAAPRPGAALRPSPCRQEGQLVRSTAPAGPLASASSHAPPLAVQHGVGDVGPRERRASRPPSSSGGPPRRRRPSAARRTRGALAVERVVAGRVVQERLAAVAGRSSTPRSSGDARQVEHAAAEDLPGLHGAERLAAGAAGHHHRVEREVAEHLADLAEDDGVAQDDPSVLLGPRVGVGGETAAQERWGQHHPRPASRASTWMRGHRHGRVEPLGAASREVEDGGGGLAVGLEDQRLAGAALRAAASRSVPGPAGVRRSGAAASG